MPAAVRPFERRDRDQLTALVNLHVAAVIPGITLSVNAVLGQLDREPQETIVDPWVAERCCLVVERQDGIAAAALLHRFRADEDVSESYRGTGEIRWVVCSADAVDEGSRLLAVALERMRDWGVRSVGADCTLPALACYGIPDVLPHLRSLLQGAGFTEPTRKELVLAARCEALTGQVVDGLEISRTLGLLGTRFTLSENQTDLGFIEVCDQPAEMARSSVARRWADIGNLVVHDEADTAKPVPALLSVGAEWLMLGGIERLIAYWADDVDPAERLTQLELAGFQMLVSNERGFIRQI
jgi:hypothetical protein